MWVEQVVRRHAGDFPPEADLLDITWEECRRILKKKARSGQLVQVILPPGQRLGHGDVLCEAPLLMVNLLPAPVIVARTESGQQLAQLALEIGNLHLPAQIEAGALVFPEDAQALRAARALGIPLSSETRRFVPAALHVNPTTTLSSSFKIVRSG